MKKVIITEKQLKTLMESQNSWIPKFFPNEKESKTKHSIADDFDDFDVEVNISSDGSGTISIYLVKYDEIEDKEDVTAFEIDFGWEYERGDSSVGLSGGFGWGAEKIRMIEPEQKDIDSEFLDMFIDDPKIGKSIDRAIDDEFDSFDRRNRY